MKRSIGFGIVVLIIATMAFGPASAQDNSQATISALQTQVADLQATVDARGEKINAQRTQIAEIKGANANSVEPTAESASGGGESVYLGGNALELLPAGAAGKLEVVTVGIYDGTELPLIVRNNTDKPLERLSVSGVARTVDGQLIAAGGDQGLNPSVVRPGEYALSISTSMASLYPPMPSLNWRLKGRPMQVSERSPVLTSV